MSDFQKHLDTSAQDPYKNIKVSQIEQKKSLEEEEEEKQLEKKKSLFLGAILYFIKKITALFIKEIEEESPAALIKTIEDLRDHIKTLEKEDVSKNSHFLKTFSDNWKDFIASYEKIYLKQKLRNEDLEKLIKEVDSCYKDQAYSLGYYLKQYKKENWHPFPFMNILEALHKEYEIKKHSPLFQKKILKESKKNESTLQRWLSLLNNSL